MATLTEIIDSFKEQAGYARAFGSPFTGNLVDAAALSLERGGPLCRIVGEWPGDPRTDVVSLRLAGALHGAVLSGKHGALAATYPTFYRPGDAAAAWPLAERFIETDPEWFANWFAWPPQTNEVRRSAALIAGLFVIAKNYGQPLALLELGASAGLNQHLDAFSYHNKVWHWGAHDDIVIDTEWHGPPPPLSGLEIAARAACDQNPLDISREDHRLRLSAYVWADQHDRMRRLKAAIALALGRASTVEKADAAAWIETRLAELRPGRTTVVYHSVFYHYPPKATRERIASAIEAAGRLRATPDAPLAWLRFEMESMLGGPPTSTRMVLDLVTWPGGERRVLAEADPHGRSVTWF